VEKSTYLADFPISRHAPHLVHLLAGKMPNVRIIALEQTAASSQEKTFARESESLHFCITRPR
jgi:hypothetical protein